MTAARPRLVDFHSHYYDPTWAFTPVPHAGSGLARSWPLLTDLGAQLDALAAAAIDTKVLSAPASSVVAPDARLDPALMREINDRFAALVTAYPGRLLALATIDAFQGDTAAAEVERAVQRLGIGGICVDCSQGDRFLDDPAARPTLEAAAALRVPVFVHPVSPPGASERWGQLGHIGILLARGSEDAVSTLMLLRSGILDALPDLTVVIPSIGAATLVFAGIADGARGRADGWTGTPPRVARRRLYIDTMGFDPAMIRFAVETVGADHVLLGSDWPVMLLAPRDEIIVALNDAGIPQETQPAILGECPASPDTPYGRTSPSSPHSIKRRGRVSVPDGSVFGSYWRQYVFARIWNERSTDHGHPCVSLRAPEHRRYRTQADRAAGDLARAFREHLRAHPR